MGWSSRQWVTDELIVSFEKEASTYYYFLFFTFLTIDIEIRIIYEFFPNQMIVRKKRRNGIWYERMIRMKFPSILSKITVVKISFAHKNCILWAKLSKVKYFMAILSLWFHLVEIGLLNNLSKTCWLFSQEVQLVFFKKVNKKKKLSGFCFF